MPLSRGILRAQTSTKKPIEFVLSFLSAFDTFANYRTIQNRRKKNPEHFAGIAVFASSLYFFSRSCAPPHHV